ncbi:AAA family ATPase [Bacillus cereus]|nr:AAA family ATPase [Bacillus cereus]
MKIVGIRIENYRSIKELILNDLGNMNIFVGKNNSGKSTILKSLDIFVNSLSKRFITKVLNKKDFYRGQIDNPIRIACSISLKDEKLNELIIKMKQEYPQLGSGLEDLINYKIINVYTSTYTYREENNELIYSYIEKITLSKSSPFVQEVGEIIEKDILTVNLEMIKELVVRDLEYECFKNNKSSLIRINLEDFTIDLYKRAKERGFLPLKYKNNDIFNDIFHSTNEYSEFKDRIQEEIDGYYQEIEQILSKETENEFQLFAGRSKVVPEHILWLLDEIRSIQILQESERKKPIEKDDAERLLTLKTARGGKERLEQLQDTVSDLLGVTIDAFSGLKDAEIDVDDFLVDMNGTGIRESLRLILDMEFSSPNLILIEEPEVHLHFELERKLFKYLMKKSNEVQIFMTTHSTGFIDATENNNILLVKKDTDTSVSTIKTAGLNEVTEELGITISSLLLSKVIVFVEGPTDEGIIRMYLEKNHPNLSYFDISIVRMTGVGNYQHYANSHALEVFNNHGLKTLFILDSDSRSEEEIGKIRERHPGTSELKILSKSCIENYFLIPSVLLKFIKQKMINSGIQVNIPTEDDLDEIKSKMEEAVESLYPETLRLFMGWKYLKPIYQLNYFSKDVSFTTIEEVTEWIKEGVKVLSETLEINYTQFESSLPSEIEEMSNLWNQKKLDIVPGSKVIDTVCKNYGIRYNKKRTDIEILTQVIKNDEWPSKLKTIFDRIAQLASE